MGKDKGKFYEDLHSVDEQLHSIQKKRQKIMVKCSHQNRHGKLKIHPVDDHSTFECKYCRQQFNMRPINPSELKNAINVLHNAIQQIRCYSDSEADVEIIQVLGELDFNNQTVQELYNRIVENFGANKDKKKHRDDRDFGGYGGGQISFLGASRGKKHK